MPFRYHVEDSQIFYFSMQNKKSRRFFNFIIKKQKLRIEFIEINHIF